MGNRQQKLARATNVLSRYFGVYTVKDLAARIALDQLSDPDPIAAGGAQNQGGGQGSGAVDGERINTLAPTEEEKRLIELLIDTTEGARTSAQLVRDIRAQIEQSDEGDELQRRFGRILQIHYDVGANGSGDESRSLNFVVPESVEDSLEVETPTGLGEEQTIPIEQVTVKQMLGYGDQETRINNRPSEPSKETPGLSVMLTNSPRVTLENQNVSAATIFLNGVPNVELQRAVPFLNVEFFFPEPPTSELGNRLQTLSLNKFLLGAQEVEQDSPLHTLTHANTSKGALIATNQNQQNEEPPEIYSMAGMELFTSPQTLVNADASDIPTSRRSNPVIDKFRPFMTLDSFNVSVAPTKGTMSFKRGTLSFRLHDRSRLPEVAEFVRADLYGTNEIQIEYGWSHPDGSSEGVDNPYGDLIDGLRVKEKYMVINSSFSFDTAGQVLIKLEIAMRGGSDFDTQLISSDNQTFSNIIKEIEELQEKIGELRKRAFPQSTFAEQREIRGRQILDASQDALSYPNLTNDLREALKEFRKEYQNSDNPNARKLVDKIQQIFGSDVRERARGQSFEPGDVNGEPSVLKELRRSIQQSIKRKVEQLQVGPDPFLLKDLQFKARQVKDPANYEEKKRLNEFERSSFGVDIGNGFPVSLSKLLLLFVGEPIANAGNYDDVQLIFYPFNEWAGNASGTNIGNFTVDVEYFADELARYKLSHISRSSVLSLRQFMSFIADTIIDDPAAPSYGLVTTKGTPLFENFVDERGRVRSTRAADDAPTHQQRLEETLRGVTPDGTFKMPNINIYVEAVPQIQGTEEGEDSSANNGKTILRLHVFDKVHTSYSSLGQVLKAARTEEINAVGAIPNPQGRNQSVVENQKRLATTVLQSAESLGLIEKINKPTGVPDKRDTDTQYRIVGGPQKLKEFIMQNTPYIIYGAGGTTVKSANLSSMQNSQLNTVNLLRSFNREEAITPSGEDAGGLPMQIIPTELSIECIGNPFFNFMQRFFVDFNTGTTADNFYGVVGIEHKFTQGDFSTSVRFVPDDAWGQYRSLVGIVTNALEVLEDIANEQEEETGTVGGQTTGAEAGSSSTDR